MMFQEIREALALSVPPHPGDPLAGLPLPNRVDRERIRNGQNIGHQYYAAASELVGIAERRLMRNPVRRLIAAMKWKRRRLDNRPAYIDTHNLGDGAVDALVCLEEAVWLAHGSRLDFASNEPSWQDEAVLALFYGSPWRLREAWDLGPVVSDPVTGELFVWPLERILGLEWRAQAVAARDRYNDLPITAKACDGRKARAQALLGGSTLRKASTGATTTSNTTPPGSSTRKAAWRNAACVCRRRMPPSKTWSSCCSAPVTRRRG